MRALCSARAVEASAAPETAARISCIPASVPETAVFPETTAAETRSESRAPVWACRSVSAVEERIAAVARAVSSARSERFSTAEATWAA